MSLEVSLNSDQRFRALIEHSSDAIALLTPEGTVTYTSPSNERITGYTAEELLGRNGFEFVYPEDLEHTRQQLTAILDQPGKIAAVEFRSFHKNGTWLWLEATLTNLLNDPAVGAVVCNYRDITQRKQEQERLQQSEERYRVLFEQAAVGIFVIDQQGHFVEANPAGCVLSGYSREELLTKTVEDLVLEEDRASIRGVIGRLRAGEITRYQRQMKRKDGSLLHVGTTVNLLATGHLLAIVRDISDRVQAEEERARLLAGEQAARAEAEARSAELSAIFEAMTEGVSVCDAGGEIRYTNAAYRSLLALEEDA